MDNKIIMIRKNNIIVFIFYSILLWGCQKEYPTPEGQSPNFSTSGKINNVQTNIIAGDNGVEINTYKSQDLLGVYQYYSFLKNSNNTTNSPEIKFKINGSSSLNLHETNDINNSIHTGIYDLVSSQSTIDFTNIKLYSSCSDPLITYDWTFNNTIQDFSTSQNAIATNLTLTGNDSINVTFQQQSGATFHSSIYLHSTSIPANYFQLNYEIETTNSSFIINPTLSYLADNIQFDSIQIINKNTGQQVSNSNQLSTITLPLISDTYFMMIAYFHNADNNTLYFKYQSFITSGPFIGTVNVGEFKYEPLNLNTNNIEITYTSSSGNKYSTIGADNSNPQNKFTVNEVLEDEVSPNGNPTKKVRGNFYGNLINVANPADILYFDNFGVEIYFEY